MGEIFFIHILHLPICKIWSKETYTQASVQSETLDKASRFVQYDKLISHDRSNLFSFDIFVQMSGWAMKLKLGSKTSLINQ